MTKTLFLDLLFELSSLKQSGIIDSAQTAELTSLLKEEDLQALMAAICTMDVEDPHDEYQRIKELILEQINLQEEETA